MAWNEPGKDKDPWGGRDSGKNNDGPPDLDEAFKKLQDKLNGIFGGGSGGGGGNRITLSERVGGAGTANQGYAGATGTAYQGPAGGGGGAGAAATNVNGATGVAVSITGSSVTYAGGGGGGGGNSAGGTGGAGGGGAGNANGNGAAGTANTGGGAGGASTDNGLPDNTGGTGGSGVVILRYPSSKTITVGAGLTSSTATVGENKVTTFTGGTGNISWS